MKFLNLTNGIEYLEQNKKIDGFVRIQSTWCEQKKWNDILLDLDYTLLINLCKGNVCYIIDYSNKKESTRALYQGVEWIKFILYKIWLKEKYYPIVKKNNCTDYFESEYEKIKNGTGIKKIKYFNKFVDCKNINLIAIGNKTKYDGKYTYYSSLLNNIKK